MEPKKQKRVCDWCQREHESMTIEAHGHQRPSYYLCERHREEVLRRTEALFAGAVTNEKEDEDVT